MGDSRDKETARRSKATLIRVDRAEATFWKFLPEICWRAATFFSVMYDKNKLCLGFTSFSQLNFISTCFDMSSSGDSHKAVKQQLMKA